MKWRLGLFLWAGAISLHFTYLPFQTNNKRSLISQLAERLSLKFRLNLTMFTHLGLRKPMRIRGSNKKSINFYCPLICWIAFPQKKYEIQLKAIKSYLENEI